MNKENKHMNWKTSFVLHTFLNELLNTIANYCVHKNSYKYKWLNARGNVFLPINGKRERECISVDEY